MAHSNAKGKLYSTHNESYFKKQQTPAQQSYAAARARLTGGRAQSGDQLGPEATMSQVRAKAARKRTAMILRLLPLLVFVIIIAAAAIGSHSSTTSLTITFVTTSVVQGAIPYSSTTTTLPSASGLTTAYTTTGQQTGTGTCENFTLSAKNSHTASGTCNWSGGDMQISCGLGIQNGASYSVTGADGKVYFNGFATSCASVCNASISVPAQVYTLTVTAGTGSGTCSGNDYVKLQDGS